MSRPTAHNALCVALLSAAIASSAGAQAPTTAPAPAPVKPASIPAFQEATLPNGLRIMLVESKRQPVVSLALMMPAGSAYDPAGKEGLAALVAQVLTKGAGKRGADEVSAAIEGVGGSLDASQTQDFMNVRANVLAENAPLAFELVADAAARPTFAPKEFDLARTQALSGIQLEQSNPATLAQHFFAEHLFGTHPYGKHWSVSSVNAITPADIRAFQQTHLVPSGALLVVAGDISIARVKELALQQFGGWSGKAAVAVKRPETPARSKTEILLVHRPGSVQSNILVGNLTYAPSSPSYYALTVASRILGGGSDGRLFKTLREQKSWTYGAYSQLTRNRDIGTFEATAEVRNAVTDSALAEMLSIERNLASKAVDSTELDAGKGGLVGSLPLQLETAQGIAEQVGRYTMLGLPKDFIRTLRPRLAAVTAPQVLAAARSYMRAGQSLVVVVGDGAQIYEKLAKIAPTKIVNAQGDAMTPADLVPRVTALPVDLTKLVARTDSFTVMVQGNPQGYQTQALAKTATGYSYSEATRIGTFLRQDVAVTFGADLTPLSVKGSGAIANNPMSVEVTFANGRAKGSSSTPGPTGMKAVTIDTTLAPGVLEGDMVAIVVPALNWSPTAKFNVTSFDASAGTTTQLALAVAGTESVTVPAGTFQAYRVVITGAPQPQTVFVSTTSPHRVLKISLTGQPVEFVLVK